MLAVIATALIGLWSARRRCAMQSHYLGIVTLGLAVAFVNWITNAQVTGGADGHLRHPRAPAVRHRPVERVPLLLPGARRPGRSPWPSGCSSSHRRSAGGCGRCGTTRWPPAPSGAEIRLLRMTAFVLASVYGGVAGVLYAGLIRYIAPETFSIANMFLLLAMVIIGGRRAWSAASSARSCSPSSAGARSTGRLRAARLRPRGRGRGRVRPDRPGRDPGADSLALRGGWRGYRGTSAARSSRSSRCRRRSPAGPGRGRSSRYPRPGASRFRGVTALDDVSLTVRAGEIRGIVGPNGSGKTTLFNVISGLYRPHGGPDPARRPDDLRRPALPARPARRGPHVPEPAAVRRR